MARSTTRAVANVWLFHDLGRLRSLLIIGVVIYVYHNSFVGPFIFDDVQAITDNPSVRQFWPPMALMSPPQIGALSGRPIANLTVAANYALGGLNVWGYHGFNLVIHILASLVLYGIVLRTLLGERLRDQYGAKAKGIATVVALIWAVHPLLTSSVTYIVQRTEVLMGLFYFITLYCFIRGADSSHRGKWYATAVIACAFGMGSKEVMVSAPLLVLAYDYTFFSRSWRNILRQRWGLYLGLASTWLLLGSLVFSTNLISKTGADFLRLTPFEYAQTQCGVILHYLRLSFWPDRLVLDYLDWPVATLSLGLVLSAAAIVGLVVLTLWGLWRRSRWAFLGAWFFFILAPTSSVLPLGSEIVGERRMYLPLAALVTLVVLSGERVLQAAFVRWDVRGRLRQGWMTLALVSLLVGSLGATTLRRNENYRSAVVIWTDTVTKRPNNARAHNNLANALEDENLGEAIFHYREALRVNPGYVQASYNLAWTLARHGRTEEAIQQYRYSVDINPGYVEARYNLGVTLGRVGRLEEAVTEFVKVTQLQPDSSQGYYNLGYALDGLGRHAEAMASYRRALQLKPDLVNAHYKLGMALARQGDYAEAIQHLESASQSALDSAPVRQALDDLRRRSIGSDTL